MNRYPLWKYLLILFALVIGLVYALPNLYGESPAVQVLPLRSNLKADTALLQRVQEALAGRTACAGSAVAGCDQRQGAFCRHR